MLAFASTNRIGSLCPDVESSSCELSSPRPGAGAVLRFASSAICRAQHARLKGNVNAAGIPGSRRSQSCCGSRNVAFICSTAKWTQLGAQAPPIDADQPAAHRTSGIDARICVGHRPGASLKWWLAASLIVVGCIAGRAVGAETPADPGAGAMEELAQQLFAPDFCGGVARRSIGIWAFDPDRVPVSSGVADRVYTSALNALIAHKPACVDVLDGSAIRDIAEHLKRTGAFREAGENPLLALERANRSVSILALGDIFAQDSAVYVSFRAVERESTVVLGQTKPWRLPDGFLRSAAADAALSLEVALQRAANQLVARAGDLRVLVPIGLY
jgi:hypothetical protein